MRCMSYGKRVSTLDTIYILSCVLCTILSAVIGRYFELSQQRAGLARFLAITKCLEAHPLSVNEFNLRTLESTAPPVAPHLSTVFALFHGSLGCNARHYCKAFKTIYIYLLSAGTGCGWRRISIDIYAESSRSSLPSCAVCSRIVCSRLVSTPPPQR